MQHWDATRWFFLMCFCVEGNGERVLNSTPKQESKQKAYLQSLTGQGSHLKWGTNYVEVSFPFSPHNIHTGELTQKS